MAPNLVAGGKRPVGRLIRLSLLALALLTILVVLAPTLVCRSGLLVTLLNQQLAQHRLRASAERVSIGWLTPTELHTVLLVDDSQEWKLEAPKIDGTQTLWQLVVQPGRLGTFTILQPTVQVSLRKPFEFAPDQQVEDEPPGTPAAAEVALRIVDGTVLVLVPEQPEPMTFAQQVNAVATWQQSAAGKILTIDPGRPLDRVQLTPEMCHVGLKYVAPVLTDVAWTEGDVSLQLEKCRIQIDHPQDSEVAGAVTLHSVRSGLRSPLAKNLAKSVSLLTQRELPQSIRLADNSVIAFQVQDQRVSHSGLRFGLPELSPDLVISTEGTVGFDKSLDLRAAIPLPLEMLGDGPLASTFGNQTLYLPIRGTLDAPQVNLEGNGQLVSDLLSRALNPIVEGDVTMQEIGETLSELRQRQQQRREERGPLLRRLRNRWRNDQDANDSPER